MQIARVPTVQEVTLVTAGVEQAFPIQISHQNSTVKSLQIKSRTLNDLKYGFALGGPYTTIFAGQTYWKERMESMIMTLYFVGTVNGQIVELEYWN